MHSTPNDRGEQAALQALCDADGVFEIVAHDRDADQSRTGRELNNLVENSVRINLAQDTRQENELHPAADMFQASRQNSQTIREDVSRMYFLRLVADSAGGKG
jgi:hypothetical protein